MDIFKVAIFLFALSLTIFLLGCFKTRSCKWPLKVHRKFQIQRRVILGAIFWSSFSISISIFSSLIILDLFNLHLELNRLTISSSIPYALIALFFSIYAFLNTLIIQQRQRQEIGSFSQLLDELCEKFDQWDKLQAEEKKKKFFFMVDYTPAIGSISERKKYNNFF
jgi:hypothetical protein